LPERDRDSIARALHDGIAQELVALAYRAEILGDQGLSPDDLRAGLREISRELLTLTRDIRDQIYLLRNGDGGDLRDFFESLSHNSTIPLNLTVGADLTRLVGPQKLALMDVAQELLRNSNRHSGASEIELHLAIEEDQCILTVKDNGKKFTPQLSGKSDSQGFGLQGVREIAKQLDGSFEIISSGGTLACLRFPISQYS
jgi:signal transduction histidine kinase